MNNKTATCFDLNLTTPTVLLPVIPTKKSQFVVSLLLSIHLCMTIDLKGSQLDWIYPWPFHIKGVQNR